MSEAVYEAALRTAGEAAETNGRGRVNLVMHGGEPTLLSLSVFRRYLERADEQLGDQLGEISLQTNGTLLDDAWLDALIAGSVGVGVSIDGPRALHDASRRDHAGRGSWQRAVESIQRMQRRGMDVGTLTVITPGARGRPVFDFLASLGVRRMNFLLPDVSHDNFQAWYGHLGPTPVADFMIEVFDAWFERDDPNLLVGICWDILERLLGGPGLSDMFGNPTLKYVVVETDGTIEALDALKVTRAGVADTGLNVLHDRLSDLYAQETLAAQALTTGFELASKCRRCRYVSSCAGGYLPHRYSSTTGFANPSVWCLDLLKLFDHVSHQAALRQQAS
jgi:uncharacterized protein